MKDTIDRVAIEWSGRKSAIGPNNTWRKMGHLGDDWLGIKIIVAGFEHIIAFPQTKTQKEANRALAIALHTLAQKIDAYSGDEAPCADCSEVTWLYDSVGVMLCADCFEARKYGDLNSDDDEGSFNDN